MRARIVVQRLVALYNSALGTLVIWLALILLILLLLGVVLHQKLRLSWAERPLPGIDPALARPRREPERALQRGAATLDGGTEMPEREPRDLLAVRPSSIGAACPQAASSLPLLDGEAIRANVRTRLKPVPQPRRAAPQLPVINRQEVELNMRARTPRSRIGKARAASPALPMVDADQVRASLQQLHGERLKAQIRRQREQAAPAPSAPVTLPSMSMQASSAPSRPSVRPIIEQAHDETPPDLPHAVRLKPRPIPALEPVLDRSARPALQALDALSALTLPVDVSATQTKAAQAQLASCPMPNPEPTGPIATAGLVWSSIEERAAPSSAQAYPLAVAHADDALPVVKHWPDYRLPGLALLRSGQKQAAPGCADESLIERGILIEEKLAEFKVKVSVVDAYAGPVITRFEVEPAVGVRGSQVVNLVKDLARALGLASIRVVETIPGKTCMGLELPNPVRQMIRLSEVLSSAAFADPATRLTLALGMDITGQPVVMDLARAPHLLVAGTTGSGKSVGVNAMILSLLYKFTPDEVRFIMIDPKMLELSVYNDIPHLLAPVVTDMKLAANALNWCVAEMDQRYRLMSALGVRNLAGYNDKIAAQAERGERIANPFSLTPETPEPLESLPLIVVVVDEFADLMMVAGKKIEELIARLAQKARAAGIHLILATQRPSVDVITGLIKANIPTRIAFQVSSKIDSRTILDQMGAEALLGQGDMLFLPPGSGYPQRIHGAFVADDEVHAVVELLKQNGQPDYVEGLLAGASEAEDESSAASGRGGAESDPLYDEAVEIVLRTRKASISSVQRHLRIGYNRAARLIEEMEAAGLVSAMESNGNRTVLAPQTQ